MANFVLCSMESEMIGPKLNRDWVGLRVRLRREASNSLCTIPAGTEGVIDRYSVGRRAIGFEGDPCECCGVSVHISGLHRSDFVILTPQNEWKDTRGQGRRIR